MRAPLVAQQLSRFDRSVSDNWLRVIPSNPNWDPRTRARLPPTRRGGLTAGLAAALARRPIESSDNRGPTAQWSRFVGCRSDDLGVRVGWWWRVTPPDLALTKVKSGRGVAVAATCRQPQSSCQLCLLTGRRAARFAAKPWTTHGVTRSIVAHELADFVLAWRHVEHPGARWNGL